MLVDEANFKGDSPMVRELVTLLVDAVGNSETALLVDSFKPGYAFEIVSVQHFAEALTAAASYDVKIGSTSVLAAAEVPAAATREDGALSTTLANLRGDADDEINLHVTTDGTGDFTGLKVRVLIRPLGTR